MSADASVDISQAKKVGFIFLRNLEHDLPRDFRLEFQNGISFSPGALAINDANWKEWLGLRWQNIAGADAVLRTEMPTANPGILDFENRRLEEMCNRAWIALKLAGPFSIETAYFATGIDVAGQIELRQISKYGTWFSVPRPYRQRLSDEAARRWMAIFHGLVGVYDELPSGRFLRLNRGLLCFQKALEEMYLDFRLPLLTRSIEALILPDKGNTTKQFVKRAALWSSAVLGREKSPSVLREIYDIRCDLDHLHGAKARYSEAQERRGCQAEVIARAAFQDIVLNPRKLERFISDKSIRAFWKEMGSG